MTVDIANLSFAQPWWLLLLAFIPLLAWLRGKRGGSPPAVPYSAVSLLKKIGVDAKTRRGSWSTALHWLAVALLVIALARPRADRGESPVHREGVDIVFAVDISNSMEEHDFTHEGRQISRRAALILAIGDFVDRRPDDRFGMVGFAGHTYLLSPLTLDGAWIKAVLGEIQTQYGTAIGDGIVSAVELLKEAKGKSKVIVVVTDGANNAGVAPLTAADLAAHEKIRIHTVIISRAVKTNPNLEAAKHLMAQVAERTGGMGFRVSNLDGMLDVARQIDRLEKSKFEQRRFRVYDELYPWLAAPAFALLLLTLILRNTIWLRTP
jgi:Ca-activated chloride channel family protein